MLILRRKAGESVIIGGNIRVEVAEISGHQVKLLIDAPREIPVYRQEVWDAIRDEMRQAASSSDIPEGKPLPGFPSSPPESSGPGIMMEAPPAPEDPDSDTPPAEPRP